MKLRGADPQVVPVDLPASPKAGDPQDGAVANSHLGQPGSPWSPGMLVKGMQRAPGGESAGMAATSVDLEQP